MLSVAFFLQVAAAEPSLPPTSSEPDEAVVVTGRRDGGKILALDFEKVAKTCDECRRTLARIEELAKPYTVKRRQIDRDHDAMVDNIEAHTKRGNQVAAQGQRQRLTATIPEHLRKDEGELMVMRRDMTGIVAAYLAQLEPIVIAAAEAERLKRGASAVTKFDPRSKAEPHVDITSAVIGRLNARKFTIQLPETEGH